jgi:hypothetical protein
VPTPAVTAIDNDFREFSRSSRPIPRREIDGISKEKAAGVYKGRPASINTVEI